MSQFILVVSSLIACGCLLAAPVPAEPDAKTLVAGLSDPDEKVRDASSTALKGRADALPWLRRAARSKAPITAARAAALIEPHDQKRQEVVAKAIDVCIRDGRIDLFIEWHQFWQPENKDDLWPVGERAAKPGMDLFAKTCPPESAKALEKFLSPMSKKTHFHDGPQMRLNVTHTTDKYVRTDRWDNG